MIGLIGRLSARVSRLSTTARLLWLNGTLCLVAGASLGIAAARSGAAGDSASGFWAVLVAAIVCTATANAALILATLWHGTPNGVVGVLAGDLIGMMPPLVIGTVLNRQGGDLARGGVFGWMVVFFLAALIVKTLLVAPLASTRTTKASMSKIPTEGAGA